MREADLIDKIAEMWVNNGGDVTGFWMSTRRIAEAIYDIQVAALDEAMRNAERRGSCPGDGN